MKCINSIIDNVKVFFKYIDGKWRTDKLGNILLVRSCILFSPIQKVVIKRLNHNNT